MTEEFVCGFAIGFLIVAATIAWVRAWYWKDQAKFLNTMWENEKKMNVDLFRQLTEKRPKVFYADSAMMSNLTDEERKALEDADRGSIYPTMVEEPLPPGTVLHEETKMGIAFKYVMDYSVNGKFSQFAVDGPAPFYQSDIFAEMSSNSEIAELQEWVLVLIGKLGNKMNYLSEAPQCALLEFWNKVKNDRDLGTQIVLIVEIEKEDGVQRSWWVKVPTFMFERFRDDLENFNRRFARPLAEYVCIEIRKKVNSRDVKKCTAFVAGVCQTQPLNVPELFTEVFADQRIFDEDYFLSQWQARSAQLEEKARREYVRMG